MGQKSKSTRFSCRRCQDWDSRWFANKADFIVTSEDYNNFVKKNYILRVFQGVKLNVSLIK